MHSPINSRYRSQNTCLNENKVSIHTVSHVASFVGLGLELISQVAICIYVECLYTRLQAWLAVCIASV